MAFSCVADASKTTNVEDLRLSESASDLQKCLYLKCKEKTGILGIRTRNLFYYFIVTFTFFDVISY